MNINLKQSNIKFNKGTVIIAGAGPGSINLISLKLKYILSIAEIIVYDALVNKEILKFCNSKSVLIFAGKIKEKRACTQSDINNWLLKYSKKNKKVLRLKGGDVSFFSRASQEVNFLKRNNVKTRIFSGITSSQASIKSSNSFFFNKSKFCNLITGHKIIKKKNKEVNYEYIRKNDGKIFIYMGVGQIKEIVKELISKGINQNEQVTFIQNASLKSEKKYSTRLNKCIDLVHQKKIKSPSIIIIR